MFTRLKNKRLIPNIMYSVISAVILIIPFESKCRENANPDKIVIHADQGKERISRNIYGAFSEHLGRCIYHGTWVGENSSIPNTRGIRKDVVKALRYINLPVLRWPGGCFADTYHWKNGIGSRKDRPCMINIHWGGVTENNHFGTHEFFDLCSQIGCEPYICGNLGSGSVREMQQWIEYITFNGKSPMTDLRRKNGREKPWKLKYFGVGNENWGCGGSMKPEFYANLYRRYATYLRNFGDNRLYKIACGPYADGFHWTEVLMREVYSKVEENPIMDGLSLHYYCGSGRESRSATKFDEEDWFYQLKRALLMEKFITMHSSIMDKYDPEKRVGLIVDEWGAWHDVEPGTNPAFLYQQNTLRDALVAGITLNIFNSHCDRVKMANIAQTINVLQSLILTKEKKMILTPTYYVFKMYKVHQDATLLPMDLKPRYYKYNKDSIPSVSASASCDKEGRVHISLCNLDSNKDANLSIELQGIKMSGVKGEVLTANNFTAHNTFEQPGVVHPMDFKGAEVKGNTLLVKLPSKSVVVLEVKQKK